MMRQRSNVNCRSPLAAPLETRRALVLRKCEMCYWLHLQSGLGESYP